MTEPARQAKPAGRSRVTIRDVARSAEVSITTVSHVLSGNGRVSKETKSRVLEAVRTSGYRPNAHAQHLVTQQSKTITIQVSSSTESLSRETLIPSSEYFLEVLDGAAQAAAEFDFALVLTAPGPAHNSDVRFTVDGAILVDPRGDEPFLLDPRLTDVPLVTMGRHPFAEFRGSVVDNNHEQSAIDLLNHLTERSYRSPAFITSPGSQSYAHDLRTGYERWIAEHDLVARVVEIGGAPTAASGAAAMRQLLAAPSPPDSVVTSSEQLAVGAFQQCVAAGLSVPADFGICSAVDSGILQLLATPITGMYLNPHDIGRKAVELLVEILEDGGNQSHFVEIPTELRPRTSTARPSSAPI